MNKIMMMVFVMVIVFGVTSTASAQPQVGIHAGYFTGGDQQKNDLALGLQVTLPLTARWSTQLSAIKYSDSFEVTTIDIIQFSATLRIAASVTDDTELYGGFGVTYASFEGHIDLPGVYVDIDDAVGMHAAVGVSTRLTDKVELFGEYRYVVMKTVAEVRSGDCREVVSGDNNVGIAIAGVNFRF